ncbi:hypothetical protein AUJ95_04025 [Candidatus Desantisbacteria bacterium CG2_30_40_21]|uniref:PorV/PorQ family protein n=3 Tax=unclassified Candidatus Desantisiibacteriota TaxID=3106372 RepID=A0A2M7JA26_9BACT|nr:MAG: hypothetical protein AUJ95_04025 [Candidatus Desantisbacteria bacterium CG2_30_40_21]PIP40347.1 MAG: hypothetical protein COX18_07045 [Candidatus Desantisbacteria bacterium CG23_combo_of_CG06-09_8_20_14_all_40_23]PIX16252.1 MAG: hypothetical protein COZ71_08260 [Candidatus Desantisbacteria bacterium CG_4_8_14_3_um_filter_40_12]
MNIKKRWLLGILIVLLPSISMANFLDLEIGARQTGMGGAFVGIGDDASTVYWNPAGLDELKSVEIIYGYGRRHNKGSINCFSLAQPATFLAGGTWGLFGLQEDVVEIKDDTIRRKGTDETTIGLGWGKKMNGGFENMPFGLLLGATLKLLKAEEKDATNRGAAIDIGLLLKPKEILPGTKEIKIGVVLRNALRTKMSEKKPASGFNLGFGILMDKKITLGKGINLNNIILSADADHPEGESLRIRLGTEMLVNQKLFWRMGTNNGDLSLGTGIKSGQWQIDYGISLNSPKPSQQISAMLTY